VTDSAAHNATLARGACDCGEGCDLCIATPDLACAGCGIRDALLTDEALCSDCDEESV
jgi:hypothetical protein